MVGRLVDQYEVIEMLGEGAVGAVYKGRDLRQERLVALKMLAPKLYEQAAPHDTARLDQEAPEGRPKPVEFRTACGFGRPSGRPYRAVGPPDASEALTIALSLRT